VRGATIVAPDMFGGMVAEGGVGHPRGDGTSAAGRGRYRGYAASSGGALAWARCSVFIFWVFCRSASPGIVDLLRPSQPSIEMGNQQLESGRFDILFANAGVAEGAPLGESSWVNGASAERALQT
jgi:hypothetical protein